jgi:hypothetical protein
MTREGRGQKAEGRRQRAEGGRQKVLWVACTCRILERREFVALTIRGLALIPQPLLPILGEGEKGS